MQSVAAGKRIQGSALSVTERKAPWAHNFLTSILYIQSVKRALFKKKKKKTHAPLPSLSHFFSFTWHEESRWGGGHWPVQTGEGSTDRTDQGRVLKHFWLCLFLETFVVKPQVQRHAKTFPVQPVGKQDISPQTNQSDNSAAHKSTTV